MHAGMQYTGIRKSYNFTPNAIFLHLTQTCFYIKHTYSLNGKSHSHSE